MCQAFRQGLRSDRHHPLCGIPILEGGGTTKRRSRLLVGDWYLAGDKVLGVEQGEWARGLAGGGRTCDSVIATILCLLGPIPLYR